MKLVLTGKVRQGSVGGRGEACVGRGDEACVGRRDEA